MTAYYNENDPKAAAWLRELIKEGHIAHGEVDERSIEDVYPNDLRGFTQCHFFAGIGGWSYALRLAGVPDDYPVWTGSCPCQPFSAAGKGAGFADERHLWPAFDWLIGQRRPDIVFGEQVATDMQWLRLVQTDLESKRYVVGSAVLGAHSVGAPHIRQRLYWVGNAELPDETRLGSLGVSVESEQETERPSTANHWKTGVSVGCADGKARPVKPGIFPLAHGVPGRVGLLRGAGNAIVPQVAAAFVKAALSV